MEQMPDRAREQRDTVVDRKATYPEGQGPLLEDVNAGTKFPETAPLVPTGSQANSGLKRREALWSELHYPEEAGLPDVDPRATGDPVGDKRPHR